MESNRSDNRSRRSDKQSDRSNQSRSNRVEFANELGMDMDKKCDDCSDKSSRRSR